MHSLEEVLPHSARTSRPSLVGYARFEFLSRYGLWVYNFKLARVCSQLTSDGVYYLKTRRRRTALYVLLGNLTLYPLRSVIVGLGLTDWLWWECHAGPLLHGRHPHVSGRTLCVPELPGIRLSQYLECTPDLSSRLAAVRLAAAEISRLHSIELLWPDGKYRTFSHGDAHTANVLIEPARQTVRWFDLEAVHVPNLSENQRRADDYRALLFSAARSFTHSELPSLLRTVLEICPTEEVRQELANFASSLARRPTGFHLAQCRLDWLRHQDLCALIMESRP